MMKQAFNRKEHVYRNDGLVELIKDAIRFFSGTPVHEIPPPEKFTGTGVYALYYIGKHDLYKKYFDLNRIAYNFPIYVGKAVPSGWRQSRTNDDSTKQSNELYRRLMEHHRSIGIAADLDASDFMCRFMIFEQEGSDMIGTIEAALIKLHRPLWNSVVDGFGNHDPGSGRYEQAKSDWDVLHEGRSWANKCQGRHNSFDSIKAKITKHLAALGN